MRNWGRAGTTDIIWHPSGGPRRSGELQKDFVRIMPKVLAARLRTLEAKAVIMRTVIETSPPSIEYSLSSLGRELVPVIYAIVEVGTRLRSESMRKAVNPRRVRR